MLSEATPLAILGALEEEIALLRGLLSNTQTTTIGAYAFTSGTLAGIPVVACRTFMGMTNSAVATTLAIEHFHPRAIISIGTAGAHDPALHSGDLVIASRTIASNAYMSSPKGQGAGCTPLTWDIYGSEVLASSGPQQCEEFFSDDHLRQCASQTPYSFGRLVEGTVASGDCWNREIDRIEQLYRQRQSLCEDMETYSIAQTCWQMGHIPWLGLRIISNSEWYPNELFDISTAAQCQEFCLNFLQQLR